MDILPKSSKEFADKQYWDKFFKQREKSFEWYGGYSDLKKVLLKYIKPAHSLLIVGCGNSSLSADLYDDGFQQNTSIDISQVVIDKMNATYKRNGMRQQLRFECMDVFKLGYEPETFNAVIDKGTLDALCSDDLDVGAMFAQIERVLQPLGRFMCVSLLQEHVATKLFSWLLEHGPWIVQIERCKTEPRDDDDGRHSDSVDFAVFVVVCTKLKCASLATTFQIDVEGSGQFARFNDTSSLIGAIKAVQEMEFVKFYIRTNKIVDENFQLKLYGEKNLDEHRYSLYFVRKTSQAKRCGAVFIVPRGREHEWIFSTAKGRQALLTRCQMDRLVVVFLSHHHHYANVDQIKDELSPRMKGFFPRTIQSIPFLTLGEDIGKVKVLHQGTSEWSGDYVIEDVTFEKSKVRRLIFLTNRNVIQSEVILKTMSTRGKKKDALATANEVIDNQFLSCEHHKFIVAGLSMLNRNIEHKPFHVLVVGLGGGCLLNYLVHNLNLPQDLRLKITAVEIDREMLDVARNWFDFQVIKKENIEIEIVIADGLQYIAQKARDEMHFDVIVFDVDSKDLNLGISCPPQGFVESAFLEQVSKCLQLSGLFILNLVARNEELKQVVHRTLADTFAKCFPYQLEEDLNEIIFCFNDSEVEWLAHKNAQLRKNHFKSSAFHMNILTHTYNELSETKQMLL